MLFKGADLQDIIVIITLFLTVFIPEPVLMQMLPSFPSWLLTGVKRLNVVAITSVYEKNVDSTSTR